STVSFNLPLGVSLSQATQAINNGFARLGAPITVRGTFQGTAKAFQDALSNQPLLILSALVAVYLVLGILYESLVHPLTILSTLPSAGVGALLALLATGQDFTIIALIGVILLIGIVKKNAIMMIDFALQIERERNCTAREAIYEACLLRLRPILMTTMAAMFGALPLAIGNGDRAELGRLPVPLGRPRLPPPEHRGAGKLPGGEGLEAGRAPGHEAAWQLVGPLRRCGPRRPHAPGGGVESERAPRGGTLRPGGGAARQRALGLLPHHHRRCLRHAQPERADRRRRWHHVRERRGRQRYPHPGPRQRHHELGARPLGPGPPHRRIQPRVRPGERRRSGGGAALGAGDARPGLLPAARDGSGSRAARALDGRLQQGARGHAESLPGRRRAALGRDAGADAARDRARPVA